MLMQVWCQCYWGVLCPSLPVTLDTCASCLSLHAVPCPASARARCHRLPQGVPVPKHKHDSNSKVCCIPACKGAAGWLLLQAVLKRLVHELMLYVLQRATLYARDELEMSTLRLRLRLPGETVKPHEVNFKLHEAEVPIKNTVSLLSKPLSGCQLQTLTARAAVRIAGYPLPTMLSTARGSGRL